MPCQPIGPEPRPSRATDNLGSSSSQTATYNVVSVSSLTNATPAPALSRVRQSANSWREGNRLAQISSKKRPPVGTTFSFTLNEQASVSFSFTRRVAGRKVGAKCVAQSPRNAKRKACRRTVTAGTLSFTGHSATNRVVFQGRVSRSKKLTPGRYTLIITASNSAGARSAPVSLSFTIVK